MSHSSVPGASILSSNPSFNPLGTIGTLLPSAVAAGSEIAAPGNPFGIAALATKGGFDLSQGNTLSGLLNLGGAGISAIPDLSQFSGASDVSNAATGVPATAGTGTAGTSALANAGGTSLTDILSQPFTSPTTGQTIFGGLKDALSSGVDKITSLFGPSTAATASPAITATELAPPGFTDLSPGSIAELNSANPAGQAAINDVLAGPTGAATATATNAATAAPFSLTSPSTWLSGISHFTSQHPFLTLGGGLVGSELLSPMLQKVSGVNNLTPAEQQLLNQEQPGLNAANSLISSEQTGVLPPGAQASVNQATQADIANIKSRYAALGMTGSSSEQADIENAYQQAAANQFGLSQQATQTGLTALGLNQSVYNTLVQDQLSRQQQLQDAFSSLFSSLGIGTALAASKSNAA